MFSRLPRAFVLSSIALLFLVFYTTFYLYDDSPIYHAMGKGHVSPTVDANGETITLEDSAEFPLPTEEPDNPLEKSLNQDPIPSTNQPPTSANCPSNLEFLERVKSNLTLTDRVRYTRRCIQPIFSSTVDRNEVVNISEPLFKDEVEVDMLDCWDAQLPECSPIQLFVPNPYTKTRFPHLIFGIATDYARLNDSIKSFAHSLANSDSKLVASVTDMRDKTKEEIGYLETEFQAAGVDVHIVKPLDPKYSTSQNHFAVLRDMMEYRGPETQWFALLDDDTFFPSLQPLSDALAKLDHTSDAYVGALSEDFASIRNFGFMAFGGAGAYLSAPLAEKLADRAVQCIEEATRTEGDIVLRDCVYTISRAKLTILPDLYQQDLQGDPSGFFEAGPRPLNLHHWKSWFEAPVVEMAKAATFCGDCFLQRWRFGNDTVLSNGYSITTYRDGLDTVDLQSMEGTWAKHDTRDFDFSIGPLRQPYPQDQKGTYRLMEAEITATGALKQLYVWYGNSKGGDMDEVVELVWEVL